MEEVQMGVMKTGTDKLLAIVDDGRCSRDRGNHIVGLADRHNAIARDGNCQLTGIIDAILCGKDVLGANDPINMLHGHPRL